MFKTALFTFLSFACIFMFSSPALAELYIWTDENGVKHFSNSPPESENASDVAKRKEVESVAPEISETQAGQTKTAKTVDRQAEKKVRKKRKRPRYRGKVVMFSTKRCGYCTMAKSFFKENGVRYKEYDLDVSAEGRREYKKLNARGVPIILVGNRRIDGFDKQALKNALGLD